MKTNYHTHSTWCDGRDTPEAMALAAVERGFDVLGFSSHSDMLKDVDAYIADIRALALRFAPDLKVLCGVEAEYLPGFQRRDFDYVIGSVHYVTAPDGARVSVDDTPELLSQGIAAHFGGSAERFVRAYFATEREMIVGFDCDIVGHLDLVRKFNLKHPYFDEHAEWYLDELRLTADALAASGKLTELNTGAISRGWLEDAYPSAEFRAMLVERGVRFILSSDAHAAVVLDCAFDRYQATLPFVTL